MRKGRKGKERGVKERREKDRVREKRGEEGGKEYRIKKYLAVVVCHMGVPAEEP